MSNTVTIEDEGYTYFAFISHKSEDMKYAKRLRRSLQKYRLPASTHKRYPRLQRRCNPIFLDGTDLTPGYLDQGLAEEVKSSKFLIIICSRHARMESKYIDDELGYFLNSGGDSSRIIPFIVDKSDHAEEECFPEGLRTLCNTQDIVGPSIYDDGWHTAILKVIARMHGIKRVELENDDLRRRKKQGFAFTIMLFIALMLTKFLCDYYLPSEEYFLDYGEVYGIPVGIHKLSTEELATLSQHWTIKSSEGKVRELRCENSRGYLVAPIDATCEGRSARAIYGYEGSRLTSVTLQDMHERTLMTLSYVKRNTVDLIGNADSSEDTFASANALSAHTTRDVTNPDANAAKSNVIRYLVTYDDNGHVSEIRYARNSFNNVGSDADGISGERYTRDEKGRVTSISYLAYVGTDGMADNQSNFTVLGKSNGTSTVQFGYDSKDDLVQISYLDNESRKTLNDGGTSVQRLEYLNHNRVLLTNYDSYGEPIVDKQLFYASVRRSYDTSGNITEETYCGIDGEPRRIDSLGYASYQVEYDDLGNAIRTSYYGADGRLHLTRDAYAYVVREYNTSGYVTKESYYGVNEEPVISVNFYSSRVIEYDDNDNVIKENYYGIDGEPIEVYGEYSAIEFEYNEKNNQVRKTFLDKKGHPVYSSANGYATIEYEYSYNAEDNGNLIKKSLLDADNKPKNNSYGYSSVVFEYDSSGNLTKESYYGADNKLILYGFGYSSKVYLYDACGNMIQERYLDDDGNPVVCPQGYASEKREYDDRRNMVASTFLDTDDKPVVHDGYASKLIEYNQQNQAIKQTFLGIDAKPLKYGCAYVVNEYDNHGNTTRTSFLDADEQPVMTRYGYALILCKYDGRNNLIRESYYDDKEQLVNHPFGYAYREFEYDANGYSSKVSSFDSQGNLLNYTEYINDKYGHVIKESYYGSNGKLQMNQSGYAYMEVSCDEEGRCIAKTFYDEKKVIIRTVKYETPLDW